MKVDEAFQSLSVSGSLIFRASEGVALTCIIEKITKANMASMAMGYILRRL